MATAKGTSAIQVILGSITISFSPVFANIIHAGPSVMGFYRGLFGALAFAIILWFRKKPLWQGWDAFWVCTAGGMLFAIDIAFWHRSVHLIGPGMATLLAGLQVFFLALIGFLMYRERVGSRFVMAAVVAMMGLYLLIGVDWAHHSHAYVVGLSMSVVSTLTYAFYVMLLHGLSDRGYNNVSLNLMTISFMAAVGLGIIALFCHESFMLPSAIDWEWSLLYGVMAQVVGWQLIARGIIGLDIKTAGLLLLVQPAFSFIWDILLFHRPTKAIEFLGMGVTLFAIYLGTVNQVGVQEAEVIELDIQPEG